MKTRLIAEKLTNSFLFLQQEYDFVVVSQEINNEYCIIKMQNNTTGIVLQYELREDDVILYLYRLVDGKFIEDKLPLSADTPLNSIDLRYVIKFKEGENYINKFKYYSSKSYDLLIRDTATDLKKYADDVLNGNFEVFDKVDAIAKKRRLEWQSS